MWYMLQDIVQALPLPGIRVNDGLPGHSHLDGRHKVLSTAAGLSFGVYRADGIHQLSNRRRTGPHDLIGVSEALVLAGTYGVQP